MLVRIASLHGCSLIALENGKVQVRCDGRLYGADEALPVDGTGPSMEALTAHEFARESTQALAGPEERNWPILARRFAGSDMA